MWVLDRYVSQKGMAALTSYFFSFFIIPLLIFGSPSLSLHKSFMLYMWAMSSENSQIQIHSAQKQSLIRAFTQQWYILLCTMIVLADSDDSCAGWSGPSLSAYARRQFRKASPILHIWQCTENISGWKTSQGTIVQTLMPSLFIVFEQTHFAATSDMGLHCLVRPVSLDNYGKYRL